MTEWSDTSQYQEIPVDDSYPHRIYSFRTNSGDKRDTIGVENARRAKGMLDRGRLDVAIAYYFFRPGQANCDLHRAMLEESGLWGHPRLVTMIDVEDANGQISGDQSAEVNDEAGRLAGWYGSNKRVIGYLNAVANAGLWRTRPQWMRFVTPNYSHQSGGVWAQNPPPQWMKDIAFAQQYTDRGQCAPWPKGVDLNYSPLSVPDLLGMFGIQGGTVADPVVEGAAQLHPFPDHFRQIKRPENVNVDNAAEAWPYAAWADTWNEVVWDGFKLSAAPLGDDAEASLIAWTLDTNKRLRSVEQKLDRALAAMESKENK